MLGTVCVGAKTDDLAEHNIILKLLLFLFFFSFWLASFVKKKEKKEKRFNIRNHGNKMQECDVEIKTNQGKTVPTLI